MHRKRKCVVFVQEHNPAGGEKDEILTSVTKWKKTDHRVKCMSQAQARHRESHLVKLVSKRLRIEVAKGWGC